MLRTFLLIVILSIISEFCLAQKSKIEVKGKVFDQSQRVPLDGVTVLSTSGTGVITDSLGNYQIVVQQGDSIYFSYQNRITGKFSVTQMENPSQFSISLHVATHKLPTVTIFGNSPVQDSLENRIFYSKYFNWQKPNPLNNINFSQGGVGMDPNAIINLFRFRHNRQIAMLQKRLFREEEDAYIERRFTPKLVTAITNLSGERLKSFLKKYRPPYDFVSIANQLELAYYIEQCFKKEMGLLPFGRDIYFLGHAPVE